MKSLLKKSIAIFLAAAAAGTLLTGCGQSTPPPGTDSGSGAASQNTAETVDCKYVVPGDEPVDYAKVIKLINDKLAKDGVGINLSIQYIPWDSWDSKINIMLSTGEDFDLFSVMNDRVTLSNYAARGALSDITDAMKQYGGNITKNDPESAMKNGQVNGVQYGVPAYWFESATAPEITVRTDLLKEYGIQEVPKTFDELTDDYTQIMKNWKGAAKPYLPLLGANNSDFGIAAKTYSSWPYMVYEKMIYVGQDGTIKDFFETDEFKKDCENARKWYQAGLINPDVITYTSDQLNNQLNSGDWFVYSGTYGSSLDNIKKNYPNITSADFQMIDLAPDKPYLRPYGTRNMSAVPAASKHPEAGVKLINWIYANQDNYDLFMYGREGTDYKKVGDKSREDIINAATSTPLWYFSDWMIGNLSLERTATGTPDATNKMLYSKRDNIVDGIASSFTFDASKVQTQMTDVNTQISAAIVPIACGVKDYDGNFANALSLLKKAGIDDIVKEYQTQFEQSKAK